MAKQATYVTKDGDMVDAIVHHHYGFVDVVIDKVMEANPHLWLLPEKLPPLTEIVLPVYDEPDESRMTRLWDE